MTDRERAVAKRELFNVAVANGRGKVGAEDVVAAGLAATDAGLDTETVASIIAQGQDFGRRHPAAY